MSNFKTAAKYSIEYQTLEKKLEQAELTVEACERDIEAFRATKCPHTYTTFHERPCAEADSYTICDICGAEI